MYIHKVFTTYIRMRLCVYMYMRMRIFGYNTQYSGGVQQTPVSGSAVQSGFDVAYDILKFTKRKSKIANLRYAVLHSAIMSYHFHMVMALWYSAGKIELYLFNGSVLVRSVSVLYYYIICRWYSCRKRVVQFFYLGILCPYNIIFPLRILHQNQHTAALR